MRNTPIPMPITIPNPKKRRSKATTFLNVAWTILSQVPFSLSEGSFAITIFSLPIMPDEDLAIRLRILQSKLIILLL